MVIAEKGCQHEIKNRAAKGKLEVTTMICVEGIIIPAKWDNKGNVVDLVLAARDEEEYLIRDKEQVTRLKSFLRQEVKIKGILRTKEGKKIIKVKKFSKLKKQD